MTIVHNKEDGGTPEIDLDEELKNGHFVLELINKQLVESSHDVGEGGIIIAIIEMCMAGDLGITIDIEKDFPHGFYFGEDQSRYLIEIKAESVQQIELLTKNNNISFEKLGKIGGKNIIINGVGDMEVSSLKNNFEFGLGHIEYSGDYSDYEW